MLRFLSLAIAMAVLGKGQSAPPLPAGLWQNTEEGFVIRVEACGEGRFCGFAAGAPKHGQRKEKPGDVCGKQTLRDFQWNQQANRWEGTMQPPNTSMKMNSSVTSDGRSFFTMKGNLLFVSKTMSFVPFKGKIGEGCRLEKGAKP